MSDFRTRQWPLPKYSLADLEKYIPIIEDAVLCRNPAMTKYLVVTREQLRTEMRTPAGMKRLKELLVRGIEENDPYRHRREVSRGFSSVTRDYVQRIFVEFLNWMSRTGYQYISDPLNVWYWTDSNDFNCAILGSTQKNVLYNPMESVGNCENVANGFAMLLVFLGVPKNTVELSYVMAAGQEQSFCYSGAVVDAASRKGAVFFPKINRNPNEYRSRVMIADGEGFKPGPPSEIDNPFSDHWVVKAANYLWDGNYACRYTDPSQICEALTTVRLQGKFIDGTHQLSGLVPKASPGHLIAVDCAELASDIEKCTKHKDTFAYIFVKPGDPGCFVDISSDRGMFSVPLRVAREWGYVVPTGWDRGKEQAGAFVKNAVATAIGNYRNDTSFWNSKSAETDGFLKSAVKWIGTSDARCKSVKAKFFENDNLNNVYALPEHPVYQNLYYVLGFDPTGVFAVPKSVVGQRLRGFLLNAFKVPARIKAAAGA